MKSRLLLSPPLHSTLSAHFSGARNLPGVQHRPTPLQHTQTKSPSPQALPASLCPRRLARLAALITLILKIHKVRSGSFLTSSFHPPHPKPFPFCPERKHRQELQPHSCPALSSTSTHTPFLENLFQSSPFPRGGGPLANIPEGLSPPLSRSWALINEAQAI